MGFVACGRTQDVHVRTEKLMSRRSRTSPVRSGFSTLDAHPERECVHCRSNCTAIRIFDGISTIFRFSMVLIIFFPPPCRRSCGRREKFSLRSSETVSGMFTTELVADAAAVAPLDQSDQGYEWPCITACIRKPECVSNSLESPPRNQGRDEKPEAAEASRKLISKCGE